MGTLWLPLSCETSGGGSCCSDFVAGAWQSVSRHRNVSVLLPHPECTIIWLRALANYSTPRVGAVVAICFEKGDKLFGMRTLLNSG